MDDTEEVNSDKKDVVEKRKLACNCGAMAKSRKKNVSKSCDSQTAKQTCSCVKAGKTCSRDCRCIGCVNSPVPEKSVPDSKTKGCTCGSTKKKSPITSCQDTGMLRKSKCPCLKNNTYCSYRCKCSSCGNKPDRQRQDVSEERTSTSIKRKRSQPEPYKRSKGVDYLEKEGFEIVVGPWTKLETLCLFVVVTLIESFDVINFSHMNVVELYNFIACSSKVREMELPIAYKPSNRVLSKLSFMNSKHGVFQSLIDAFNEEIVKPVVD